MLRSLPLQLLLAVLLAFAWAGSATAAPQRIVSLNLCGDELLLRLAEREDIASVTFLASDPRVSSVSELAAGLPQNNGQAEEVLPLRPDLVIAEPYTTRSTVSLLRRLGVEVLELPIPTSLPEVYEQVRQVADAIGRPEKGRAMIARMKWQLDELASPPGGQRPLAAVYQPNGFIAGPGSLVDEVLHLAGLRNLASESLQGRSGQVALELLLWHQPDILIVNSAKDPLPSMAHALLNHPALEHSFRGWRRVRIEPGLWSCGGPGLVEAVARLREASRRLQAEEAG